MASPPSYTAQPSEDVVVSEDEDHIQDKNHILSQQVDSAEVKIGFFSLYRYATLSDRLLLLLSVACCVIAGAAVPGMTVSQRPPTPMINSNAALDRSRRSNRKDKRLCCRWGYSTRIQRRCISLLSLLRIRRHWRIRHRINRHSWLRLRWRTCHWQNSGKIYASHTTPEYRIL